MTQSAALTLLKTGKNVFVTGPAGSGKTFVINEYIKYLKDHDVAVGITASTGIAATHMGGMTIHAWSGMGIKDHMNEYDLESLAEKKYLANRFQAAQVLIIDEVSMLHHFRLDMLDKILRRLRRDNKFGAAGLGELPFGGLQVVLCGDFFQLPPVSRLGEPEPHFVYNSQSWADAGFTVCYLSEQHRQKDDISLSILNEIRSGEVSDEAREHLRSRYNSSTEGATSLNGIEPTRLFTHNADVDGVNDEALSRIKENEFLYEMRTKGKSNLVQTLKKTCLAPEVLRLRKGARVMCVKNNFEQGYVNGTLGVVISCGPNVSPIIKTASGKALTIEEASWKIEEDGRTLAELIQYPLRLAWAITVHKSQGMSLDAIEVDLSKSFEPGMGYVALSRVRTLAGLTILGMNEMALKVNSEVLEHDFELRGLSLQAEEWLEDTDPADIIRMQEEYIARIAPLYSYEKGRGKRGRIRRGAPKISTIQKTGLLIQAKKSLNEIAKERGMTAETIISHIEQLVEAGEKPDMAYLKREISFGHWGKIEKALEEVSIKQNDDRPPLLSPVKTKLGPNISFKEIRLARALLGYIK